MSAKKLEPLPEVAAMPGDPLPALPDSAYPDGATPLDPVEVEVVMVAPSRGSKPGEKRTVDGRRAADLVRAGLAKYSS